MIRAIIIDDEKHCIDVLQHLIARHCPQIDLIGMFSDPLDALLFLKETRVDLIFTDIEMPNLSGFDLLKKLGPTPAKIIFTTAYNQYALEAFKFSAVDYLLKPIGADDLMAAVDKLVPGKNYGLGQEQIDMMLRFGKEPNHKPKKIALATLESLEFVEIDNIIYCQSDKSYTYVYMKGNKRLLLSKNLKDLDDVLSPCGFFRIHNSFLINLDYVVKYIKGDGGFVKLTEGEEIPVSRLKKHQFLEMITVI
ncbi:MAG: response regulator transcription factor [Saprospiraceae bacterium]|mgnify:FL=1|nr:response regulator transcription factor [Saprospiraceae bacterium]